MSIIKFWKMLFCFAWMPLYLGGDSDSDSSTSTTSNTTNTANSWDKRVVASDAAVGLSGDANWMQANRTTDSSTSLSDSSNRSSTDITTMMDMSSRDSSTYFSDSSAWSSSTADNSNRSTNFTDNSTRTSSFVDSSMRTDYGSIGAALAGLGSMTNRAFGISGDAINNALTGLKSSSLGNQESVMGAFDMTKQAGANSLANSAAVIGFANTAIDKTKAAFADAADGGRSKMTAVALTVAGVVAVAYILKRA